MSWFSSGSSILVELEFGVLGFGFWKEENWRTRRKMLSVCKVRAHKKHHPHMASDRDVHPGHIGGGRALSTLRHRCSISQEGTKWSGAYG